MEVLDVHAERTLRFVGVAGRSKLAAETSMIGCEGDSGNGESGDSARPVSGHAPATGYVS
jgi:hypothetical protein